MPRDGGLRRRPRDGALHSQPVLGDGDSGCATLAGRRGPRRLRQVPPSRRDYWSWRCLPEPEHKRVRGGGHDGKLRSWVRPFDDIGLDALRLGRLAWQMRRFAVGGPFSLVWALQRRARAPKLPPETLRRARQQGRVHWRLPVGRGVDATRRGTWTVHPPTLRRLAGTRRRVLPSPLRLPPAAELQRRLDMAGLRHNAPSGRFAQLLLEGRHHLRGPPLHLGDGLVRAVRRP
mmetsp:Transcript_34912/g.96389  ORF Transcript_34912/g.96389 Transcript_34912/m.96389 type:complete len:232 (+) Transcript_34912:309-1004(+)